MSNVPWSEKEEDRLRALYISTESFEDIVREFPRRTTNAIRIKASRLGIKRPSVTSSKIEAPNVLKFLNGNGRDEDYFFKCSGCGNWIHVNLDDDKIKTIICPDCNSACRYVA
jgi:DNA-directed RNA polymerase subunit RPC12/RpoP